MQADSTADIGIFGGSGFYTFGEDAQEVDVYTPFGAPSAPVTISTVGGRRVAFIPRHGRDHQYAPAKVPARANLWAMRTLGVTQVIGPCAAGSLSSDVHPGEFVVLDQLVDRTWGRPDTFYDAGDAHHVSYADPYCPVVAGAAVAAGERAGVRMHPRQYPEAYLARELGMHYAGIALVTDYDTGVVDDPGIEPVTQEQVFAFFEENLHRVRQLLDELIPGLGDEPRGCSCKEAIGPLHKHGG